MADIGREEMGAAEVRVSAGLLGLRRGGAEMEQMGCVTKVEDESLCLPVK